MRVLCLLSFLLCSNLALASETNPMLKEVVLGVDFEAETEEHGFMFPCSVYMGVVFCDNRVMLEDRVCSRSLSFTKLSTGQIAINCRLSSGEHFTLARTFPGRAGLPVKDETIATGYYFLEFSPRVIVVPASARQTLVRIR
jgi:hypothetical protein